MCRVLERYLLLYLEYEPINGKCSLIDDRAMRPAVLVGCLKSSGGKCLNCANGFRKVNEQCVEGVKECADYNADGSCGLCNQEFSLMFGECRHNRLLGCKHELPDHRCADCFAPFELDNYNCGIRHCKKYNDFGCYSCECGFYITENRECKQYD